MFHVNYIFPQNRSVYELITRHAAQQSAFDYLTWCGTVKMLCFPVK